MNDDVIIIGGGFAGLNIARLLKPNGISCQIFTSEGSASSLWAGTVDVVNLKENGFKYSEEKKYSLDEEIRVLLHKLPQHPYALMDSKDIYSALDEFFHSFPQFTISQTETFYHNSYAMTAFGTLKPCVARWNSIFGEFERLTKDSKCIIVDFIEFSNSASELIKKGLESRYPGVFRILKVNLRNVLTAWGDAGKKWFKPKLSLKDVAEILEQFHSNLSPFVMELQKALAFQYSSSLNEKVDFYLFPPIMGNNNYRIILNNLNHLLKSECYETIGLSPSIMGSRLLSAFEQLCASIEIKINRGYNFSSLQKSGDEWQLTFIDRKQTVLKVLAKKVIFATGSLFMSGPLVTDVDMQQFFAPLELAVPNPMDRSFQLVFNDHSPSSLYCCGSATYRFKGGVTDNDEIRYCTGLGLAIISSWITAQNVYKAFRKK
jgi:anaerobic glycerol-3-phosphate dehydrogenase